MSSLRKNGKSGRNSGRIFFISGTVLITAAALLLGGYLFHMVWEVKGRYGLFYFAILLPSAAAGLEEIRSLLAELLEKRKKKEI